MLFYDKLHQLGQHARSSEQKNTATFKKIDIADLVASSWLQVGKKLVLNPVISENLQKQNSVSHSGPWCTDTLYFILMSANLSNTVTKKDNGHDRL